MALAMRIVRSVVLAVGLFAAALVVWSFYYIGSPAFSEARRASAERQSFAELARCQTVSELEEVTDWLGVVLKTRDGGWIAIRYRDSHKQAGGLWSSAVARDSDGRWYVSSEHFCGRFQGYRLDKKKLNEGFEAEWLRERSADYRKLEAIESCADVGAAAPLLLDIGFQPAEPPAPAEEE
jgi:hypothetical protein